MRRLLALVLLLAPVSAHARTRAHHPLHHRTHHRLRVVATWRGPLPVRRSNASTCPELPSRPSVPPKRELVLAGIPVVGPSLAGARDALWSWQNPGQ